MTINPEQVKAAEAVLRQYIPDTKVSAAGAFLEALSAYLDAEPGKKKRQRPEGEPDGFAPAYDAYPRKVARKVGAEAYGRALARATPEIILAGIKRYAIASKGKEAQHIAHIATWLNQDRWKDELNGPEGLVGAATFEPASLMGWVRRLEMLAGRDGSPKGTWRASSWGPKPGEPGCKVPEEAGAEYRRLYPRKTA